MAKLRVAFIHPSLVIGGAEQLIVNLALSLVREGHEATIYTPYHHNSFPQTHDGTIKVVTCGSFFGIIPRTFYGRFHALLATIRTFLCTLWMICYGPSYELVVCDQVSVSLPLLKLARMRTIFYCHFPDKLQSKQGGFFKKLYRLGLDFWEEVCIWFADLVYVNSQFTQGIFQKHFAALKRLGTRTEVLYPAIDFSKFNGERQASLFDRPYFVSLNRYERKKDIKLAIEAFALLPKRLIEENYLVIAGGFDDRVAENVEHYKELQDTALAKGIAGSVRFMRNITDGERVNLLTNSVAVLYTPENEHFGIVPCEAMYSGVPVIAANCGGPMESVADGSSGFLVEGGAGNAQRWAAKLQQLLSDPTLAKRMGQDGKRLTEQKFGMVTFSRQFLKGVNSVVRH